MIGQVEFYEKAGFQNILSERCYEYLVEKETIGVQIQKPMGMLLRFLRMCLANGEPLDHASKSAVECWNEKDINETPRNHYYRATEIRRFMQYLEKAGIDAYVDRDIRRVQSSFVPYIFSYSEIVRLFAAADGLPYTPISPQRVYVMSLLFRMLYGCGLRISEALNLVMADVDLDQGILYIRNSKFGKERLVPMSESLTFRCFQYVSNVGKHRKDEAAFFQTPCGGHYASGTILYAWRQTLYCAGISYGGKGKGPRIHDLRHPYVKHTTKVFSLRLMDFQAQAYPDARRKTRGACQLRRGGQSQSPVHPLCNRKRFSYLPPQSKIFRILYAISMRLSGYTSTRSISSSASSVVSASASKIALDASFRLSCRACSSCFCFACANTAA